jgi:nitrite reductase/ring-hydroxylating ferredoxin subunit
MARIKLARADEIPEGGLVVKEHGGRRIVLAKVEGTIHALDDECTHAGAPLHEGELGREGKHMLTCPWHEAHFDVRTACHAVTVADGDVYVDF